MTTMLDRARDMIHRYRTETPPGNQPHMIADEADELLADLDRARPDIAHHTAGWVFVGYRHEPNYPGDPEWCDEHGEFIEPQPTHWKPLPAPPIATESASQEVGK